MEQKELEETMRMLEDAGWQPQLCDTPIPLFESVHAGNPTDPGQIPPDMVLVPRAFIERNPESMVRVQGNSMIDRDIEDGDSVRMVYGRMPHDGDIVVVAIGTECTVKSYYEDDDGVAWLVPQNKAEKDKYKVIRLDDCEERVYLCGVVIEVCKALPRVPSRAMRSLVDEAKAKYEDTPRISEYRVECVIKILGAEITIARRWYGVCRGMMDEKVVGEKQYDVFCKKVKSRLPYHLHLPKESEMQAMAVGSFAKPVYKWDERNSPVKGKRFEAYKAIAEKTISLLTMSDVEFDSFQKKL